MLFKWLGYFPTAEPLENKSLINDLVSFDLRQFISATKAGDLRAVTIGLSKSPAAAATH